jgi:oxaloacetate decarboxylase beta subunit
MNKKFIISLMILFFALFSTNLFASSAHESTETTTEVKHEYKPKSITELMTSFYETTGINAIINPSDDVMTSEPNPADARKMTTFEQTCYCKRF